jgi:urease accessory protein
MTEPAALQRLLTWLSPAFPVGAFAWSAGLETAIAERRVTDAAVLRAWIEGALAHGGLRTDAILLAHAHKIVAPLTTPSPTLPTKGRVSVRGLDGMEPHPQIGTSPLVGEDGREGAAHNDVAGDLQGLADLCLALTPAAERNKETLLTGDAFVAAARAWPSNIYARLPEPCPYPIAVGAIAAAHGVGIEETLLGFLTAAVQAQVSVAIRLVPLGQTDGLAVVAALEARVAALAGAAATAALDDIGGIAYAADIAQMRHEMLEPRIFRS